MFTKIAPVCSCQPDVHPEIAVWLTWKTSTESFVRSLIGSVLKLTLLAVTPSARTVDVDPPAGPAGVARATPLPMTVATRAKTPPIARIRRGVADAVRFIEALLGGSRPNRCPQAGRPAMVGAIGLSGRSGCRLSGRRPSTSTGSGEPRRPA